MRKIIGCSFYVKLRGYQGHQVPENQPSWKTWESFLQPWVKRLPFWQLTHPQPQMEVYTSCLCAFAQTDDKLLTFHFPLLRIIDG
jgi:hypothetical protein